MLELQDIKKSGIILRNILEQYPTNGSSVRLFNEFVTVTLQTYLRNISEQLDDGTIFKFDNIILEKPTYEKDGEIFTLFPQKCRTDRLSYVGRLLVDAIKEDADGNVITRYPSIHIGSIPIMKGSVKCNLYQKSDEELPFLGEDPKDPDGYFIIGGTEKVILYQEQLSTNRIFLMMNNPKDGPSVRLTTSEMVGTHVNDLVLDKKNFKVLKIKLPSLKASNEDSQSSSNPALMVSKASDKKYGTLNVLKVYQILGYENLDDIMELIFESIPPENHSKCKNYFLRTIIDFNATTRSRADTIARLAEKIIPDKKGKDAEKYITDLFHRDLFHHLNNVIGPEGETPYEKDQRIANSKAEFLSIMVAQMLEYMAGFRPLSDRNSWSNKKTLAPSGLIQQLFSACLRRIISTVKYPKKPTPLTFDALVEALTTNKLITDSFFTSFNTPNWGVKGGQTRPNIAQTLSRESLIATYAHLSTIDVNISRSGNTGSDVKIIQMTAWGLICSIATPEGENCGLLKNFAILVASSLMRDDTSILKMLVGNPDISPKKTDNHPVRLMINVKPAGWCDGDSMRKYFLNLRRTNVIPRDTSIVLQGGWLNIDMSPYRPIRPLFIVETLEDGTQRLAVTGSEDDAPNAWFSNGQMEYLSAWEQEQKEVKIASLEEKIELRNKQLRDARNDLILAEELLKIAQDTGTVTDPQTNIILTLEDAKIRHQSALEAMDDIPLPYTHCEVDPKTQFSVQANLGHYPDHNQGPRNTYQASMGKQATSVYHSNFQNRMDGTVKMLPFGQAPLVTTEMYDSIGLNERNCGLNVNVLMGSFPYTEEDAFVGNRDYFAAGGHRMLKHSVYKATFKHPDILALPPLSNEEILRGEERKYRHIQKLGPSAGLPMIGAYLSAGDCIVAKVADNQGIKSNISLFVKIGEEGIVEKVIVTQTPDKIETTVMVKIRICRIPSLGDKFAPRNAQKGTIALIVPDVCMPFTNKGIAPSLIANPSCLPSRMTISYPMEMVMSKYAAFQGRQMNGSAFYQPNDARTYQEINREFASRGKLPYGYEKMHSGLSGIQFAGDMNMSLVYFQSLKHTSKDKHQARGTGQVVNTTRQPPKGRANGGGLKFGEMERDAILSHGATSVLLERLMYVSDAYSVVICKVCGSIVSVDAVENGCKLCGAVDPPNFVTKTIPYAFKFLVQLLGTLGIFESARTVTRAEYAAAIMDGRDIYGRSPMNDDEDLEEEGDEVNEDEEDGGYDDMEF